MKFTRRPLAAMLNGKSIFGDTFQMREALLNDKDKTATDGCLDPRNDQSDLAGGADDVQDGFKKKPAEDVAFGDGVVGEKTPNTNSASK